MPYQTLIYFDLNSPTKKPCLAELSRDTPRSAAQRLSSPGLASIYFGHLLSQISQKKPCQALPILALPGLAMPSLAGQRHDLYQSSAPQKKPCLARPRVALPRFAWPCPAAFCLDLL